LAGRQEFIVIFDCLGALLQAIVRERAKKQVPHALAAESADDGIRNSERQQRWQHAMQALAVALAALPAEDRLIAKMVGDDIKVVQIAASLGLDQKALYKRKERILKRLREDLENAGVSAGDVAELLGDADD